MASKGVTEFVQIWKNETDPKRPFKLMLADVHGDSVDIPPKDFVLEPGTETKLSWNSGFESAAAKTVGQQTSGYLRFWSVDSKPGKLGSGITFGVKIEQDITFGGERLPPKILTYVGSPTGNPDDWTDVTESVDPKYTFAFKGESITVYGVTIERLITVGDGPFPVCSLLITIKTLYLITDSQASVTSPLPWPNYLEEWQNDSESTFELQNAEIKVPDSDHQPITPPPGSKLGPGQSAVLAWSCPVPPGVGQTTGFLRYWSKKSTKMPGSGHVSGVMIEQDFGLLASGEGGEPEPPKIKIYNGSPTGSPFWDDVTKEIQLKGSYTFMVPDTPAHGYAVTIELLFVVGGSRCAIRVSISDAVIN